jgi:hypothetical protein
MNPANKPTHLMTDDEDILLPLKFHDDGLQPDYDIAI